ncbi:carbon-nitrogen hydrolase family protein [Paenibacillus sp. J5C_2022]|uniref:carbon-nitrogen hydrolase family protein n=1 Tax=Paenibacillus sp. J5C2022 TaxID=2977129 RepID=UPI0021D3C14A|nr:carbon-nitrogen hydrolase family protein [Paenibacillus sp. J5C2022]MCU6712570.1 carbon-nitrogen hydrolase family protein [Paenibacillus sp. J5C2022]
MANYVKISCLGPSPAIMDMKLPLNEVLQQMIQHWQKQLDHVLPDKPDIIVLPEACDRPESNYYTLERRLEYYRYRKHAMRDFFSRISRENNCYIAYSAHVEAADGSWRNATQWLDRTGAVIGVYHKNHLVPMEYEEAGILYGNAAPILRLDFGTVASAICFDLNFEQLRQQYEKAKPDIIVFSSMYHGGLMQPYWAYSCRSFFAGAVASLPCTILNRVGDVVASSTNYYPFVTTTVNLDSAVIHIDNNHFRFQEIKEKYGSDVIIYDPGFLGAVQISSESKAFSIQDIIDEFQLERVDDYFNDSLAHRSEPGRIEM